MIEEIRLLDFVLHASGFRPEPGQQPDLCLGHVVGIRDRGAKDEKTICSKKFSVSSTRVPFFSVSSVPSVVKDVDLFRSLVKAGQRLAQIHVHYEQQPEYPLTKREKEGEKLDWRVTKMRLSKDKTTLTYNQFLTLSRPRSQPIFS